ncbi:Rz1 lysis protein [Pectobacterium phage PP47]|uniref:Rz1 lysis protein n=2 Tax=Pektosvirus TaxID=2732689 RepID=A0A1L7DS36_9CAUD|nr:Rz-like spanin [Pectobacterium phage PP81]YP_009788749.1 Rz-like spanin [Pectobacterium phage PP47]APU03066.2 Rz1 lysis protein [Pectobacterium phage PP81]APW79788.1 Rz1 lysis protein [Pectobacterium phage PP47]
MKFLKGIKKTSQRVRLMLTGLLVGCVLITSGCQSKSSLPPEPNQVTVDASLMVEPSYTNQLLQILSE